jgi:heptosyltransferase III
MPDRRRSLRAPRRIIVSRTDRIGDVVLTFPLLGLLRERWPDAEICFLGRRQVSPVVGSCVHVDRFVEWRLDRPTSTVEGAAALRALDADVILHLFPSRPIAAAARAAGIPRRIGTNRRWYHWLSCTELVNLGRGHSVLHEAQLNVLLASPLLGRTEYSLAALVPYFGFTRTKPLDARWAALLAPSLFNLILVPMTGGSVPAWRLESYGALIDALSPECYRVFVAGTAEEGAVLRPWLSAMAARVTDVTGQSLEDLISFVGAADGLLAASTGPLHIAAALGIRTLGLFPPHAARPLRRWGPLGARAEVLVAPPATTSAARAYGIEGIGVSDVLAVLERWATGRR